MSETPPEGLTPPGPPTAHDAEPPRGGAMSVDDWIEHARGRAAPPVPTNPYLGAPRPAPAPSTDKGLGWTAFGLALALCFPLLPLAGAVLAVVALARRRFRPTWVAVLALLAGLAGTALQVAVVASPDFWDGIRDGVNESLEDETEDARRSGEPTEVNPFKLRKGDCINDAALKGIGDEQIRTETVTLLPCRAKHDLEVYATLHVPGRKFPGQPAIDRTARGCFPAFKAYVGKAYPDSELEIFYYFPTEGSWRLLGDKTVTCVVGHPKHQVRGTLKGAKR